MIVFKMGLLWFFILAFCNGIYAEEVLVQVNLNKPLNVISDRFLSFFINPNFIIENLNKNNSDILTRMASRMNHAFVKLSMVPLPLTVATNEIMTAAHEKEVENWRMLHEWFRSVDWIPIVPLPYNPKNWKSVTSLRILNVSSIAGVKQCIWQLGSDFDIIGATSYVGDLITLQTMVDAFENVVENWKVVGADISAGSDPEETRLYSDLTKHVVEAIGWMQLPENYIPESQNSMIPDNDYALKTILERNTAIWLSIASHSNMAKRSEKWSGISIADGVQWTRMLGDAARIGFDVIYKPLREQDFFEENFSYFTSLLFKQIMGNKVFDAHVIGGNRFISHVYCHCTTGRPGALSIMAVNIGENRHKLVTKLSSKHSGTELWQYILTSNNKTIYLNGEPIHFNSTIEPFIKVKHPSRPINLTLPPMSIGFWILPLANHDECLKGDQQINNNDHKKYTRVRSSSDLLLQHLIEKSTTNMKAINSIKPVIEELDCSDSDDNCKTNKINRQKRSTNEYNKKDNRGIIRENSIFVNSQKDKVRGKRNIFVSEITKNKLPTSSVTTIHEIPNVAVSPYFHHSAGLPLADHIPGKNTYYEVIDNGPKDPRDEHILKQLMPILQSDEIHGDRIQIPQAPAVFYEVYNVKQKTPKLERKKFGRSIYPQYWSQSPCQHRRARRSTLYKGFSLTNFITKDMGDGGVIARRYVKLPLNDNIKPISFNEVTWENPIPLDSEEYEMDNLIENAEEIGVNNNVAGAGDINIKEEQGMNSKEMNSTTAEDNNSENHAPKFMIFLNENISKFMKTLNNHITGWWNTWG